MTTTETLRQVHFRKDDNRITWVCNSCGQPIRSGTGYIETDDGIAYRRDIEKRQRERDRILEGRSSWEPVNLTDLLERPWPVPWLAWHRPCDPDIEGATYWIDVDRIDTLARLIHWAGHLMGKRWIGETDWDELLERIGEYA